MIAHVRGVVAEKSPAGLVVEVGGVGLAIAVPLSSLDRVPDEGRETTLLTYLHVREDALSLYGFVSREERELFLALLDVAGVGPKLALACLSAARAEDLRNWIGDENVAAITRIPGVGRKTAERIVVDLKERVGTRAVKGAPRGPALHGPAEEAALALEALGMKEARERVADVVRDGRGRDLTPEEIVRHALARGAR